MARSYIRCLVDEHRPFINAHTIDPELIWWKYIPVHSAVMSLCVLVAVVVVNPLH